MTKTRLTGVLMAAATLAGCAQDGVDRAQFVISEPSPAPVASSPRAIDLEALTYAMLDGSSGPLILATLSDGESRVTLTPASDTAGGDAEVAHWVASDGMRLGFRGVQLVSTQSLSEDLMDVHQSAVLSNDVNAPYSRAYHHNDADGMRVSTYTCAMAPAVAEEIVILDMPYDTFRLDETCTGAEGAEPIRNAYWIGETGTLWQSRQWVSASLGSIDLKRLVR